MKIDTALKEFVEKYDQRSMQFIQEISQNYALVKQKSKLPLFNIQESFDKFQEYLQGYGTYKLENVNNDKASPQNVIQESVSKFIEKQLFKDTDVLYSDIPKFVESYISGVKSLSSAVNQVKTRLMESGMDADAIANVNDFSDQFMVKLHESFDPAMDKILLTSGYKTRIQLENAGITPKKETHTFL